MKLHAHRSFAALAALAAPLVALAGNPVVQTVHTADPAPMVHDGTLYLYTGHDEDTAKDGKFLMRDYRCFSTTDMVNWTDHGSVLDLRTVFPWVAGDANAAQVIERNGKFYYYVSPWDRSHPGISIGVAVGDSPTGPFKDPLGRALITRDDVSYAKHGWQNLDPTVFIDDDGRAFLYWGNNACYYAELNDDMISLKGPITAIPLTKEAFGSDFEEAPWIYKRNGLYYMIYAAHIPEAIRYATSKSITGPWTYGGEIMKPQETNGSNHPAIIDYKGNSYFFYHTDALANGYDQRRSVAIESFTYGADGSIPLLKPTLAGVAPVGTINPFRRVEAETIAWAQGVKTEKTAAGGIRLTSLDAGDYIQVREVDFGAKSPGTFVAGVSAEAAGGVIDVRLDSPVGRRIARIKVDVADGLETEKTLTAKVREVTGVHDVYFVFGNPAAVRFTFDWWRFE